MPSLDALAAAVGVSPHHLHRLFKTQTGLTPHKYAAACRNDRARKLMTRSTTVAEAIYRSGFNSSGRFYESAANVLGMTPTHYRTGGQAIRIQFATAQCSLGHVLVAATNIGICAVLLGDNSQALITDLRHRFPNSELVNGDDQFEEVIAAVVELVSTPTQTWNLPMDICGTAFQHRVWDALRKIPPGSTNTYTEIAHQLGRPKAVRAVAQACAANAMAVAIPCHRVVRTDGSLAGYRWGIERKRELLRRERDATLSSDEDKPID